MKEFSCIIVMAFGAARPGTAPSMALAPASPVIFSTSRRDADRTRLAIPFSLHEAGLVVSDGAPAFRSVLGRYGAAIGEVNLALTRTEPATSVGYWWSGVHRFHASADLGAYRFSGQRQDDTAGAHPGEP